MNETPQEVGGKGCIYAILILLAAAIFALTPALVGVEELAKQHRIEAEQIIRKDTR